ncbi:DUF2142 domain-containing protein [Acidovorax sp. sic0104]|uniref:DUF2142 domain-containing protein n=1 Tax=Acidovorax sp. sic0104 TaxID=2854784 RepID=UPI001C48EE47|nr:DUF2142 domain-containing protein [Acidovorax sp. sic0104]MBV7540327.1 DUF2142 domain-containing protein [Acidovorax sp. sic0104]
MRLTQQRIKFAFLILIAIVIAAGITRLIPPVQSPDENVHLLRADMISHGQLLLQPGASGKGREGGLADANFIRFSEAMLWISGKGANKDIASELWDRAGDVKWAHKDSFYNAAGTGYYLPVIYIPHALGLFTSRKLDLSMEASYELTRTLVVATSLTLMVLALSMYTPNVLSLMLLATPMALFQFSSPTIDGLCAAMAILVIGLWFSVSASERYLSGNGLAFKEVALYGLIIVLCTARTNLLPILLIPLVLAISRPSRPRIATVALVYMFTFAWIAFAVSTTHDSRVVREHSTSSILISYLSSPLEFIDLLASTIGDNEIRRFYRDSYFGILGWLDTPIPRHAVRILYAAAIVSAVVLVIVTPWRRAAPRRAMLLFMGLSSTFLIFLALAITWTNYPADRISGIQGRYFLVPTLFIAAALGKTEAGVRTLRPVEILAFCAFLGYSLYLLATTLMAQYKLSSQYF